MIRSFFRPTSVRKPASSSVPRSPVSNQPLANAACVASGFRQYSRNRFGTADHDRADFAGRNRRAVGSDDLSLNALQRQPDRAGRPRAVEREARDHVRLGHAVAIDHGASQETFKLRQQFRLDRGRSAGEEAHVRPATGRRAKGRVFQTGGRRSRDGHEDGPLIHRLERPRTVERVFNPHAAPGQPGEMRGKRQTVDVKQAGAR